MARSTHPATTTLIPIFFPKTSRKAAMIAVCAIVLGAIAFGIDALRAQQPPQSSKSGNKPDIKSTRSTSATQQITSLENTGKPSRRNRIVIISTDGSDRARIITDSTDTVVDIDALNDSLRSTIQEALSSLEDISVQNSNGVISFHFKGRDKNKHRIIRLNTDSIAGTISSSVARSLRGLRDRLKELKIEAYDDSVGQASARNFAITMPRAPRIPKMPRLHRYWEWNDDTDNEFTSPEARKLDAEAEAMRIEAKAARKKAEAEALLKESEAMRKQAEAVRKEAEAQAKAKAKSPSEQTKPTQAPKQNKNE
jgi:hypothetical protein